MKYRKKPVVVEAFKFSTDSEIIAPDWFVSAVADEKIWIDRGMRDGRVEIYGCTIETPEGKMHAKVGDYIIKGVCGELYPCKSGIFKKTYEKC